MSTIEKPQRQTNATAADCDRLWRTLTQDYIPGLRIQVRIVPGLDETVVLQVEVVDDSAVAVNGENYVNVWGIRQFASQIYLISIDQLFGLLIDSFKTIDAYFRLGEQCAPPRRRV